MLELHWMRLAIVALMLVAVFGLATQLLEELPIAAGLLLVAYWASSPIFHWVKKRFVRPVIMFDLHGVYFTGDLALVNFHPMQGMPELVERLRQRYCVVAFTNMSPELFNFWNSRWGITGKFDYVFFSGKIRAKKPDPQAFKIIVSQLGVKPSDIVFFDDVVENVKGAASVGIKAVHFQSPSQAVSALREMGVKI